MSHTFVPVPPSSCPTCSSKEINNILTSYPFIFSGFCFHCNNICTSTKKLTFYQCVCYPPFNTRAATIGFESRFPKNHKDSLIHQKHVTLFTQSTQPGSQRMDDVEDFDEMSLNFSTMSNNSHDNMESTSDIDNRVGSIVKFPPTFDSKEHLDFSCS